MRQQLTYEQYQELQKQKLLREEQEAFRAKVQEIIKPLEEEIQKIKAELATLKKPKKTREAKDESRN